MAGIDGRHRRNTHAFGHFVDGKLLLNKELVLLRSLSEATCSFNPLIVSTGYGKIAGELFKLGFDTSQTSIRNTLDRHGIVPAPVRNGRVVLLFSIPYRDQAGDQPRSIKRVTFVPLVSVTWIPPTAAAKKAMRVPSGDQVG